MPSTIVYTKTDEAPALATASFLPIVRKFAGTAGIEIQIQDISLAARILANAAEYLQPTQRVPDALQKLGDLATTPEANIIKLPNISASVPQLKNAIAELQSQGFQVPDYPEEEKTAEQKKIRQMYSKVLGSAVNPVLREGNSDRRVAKAVKKFAKNNPHSMGAWTNDSKAHVTSMSEGDFFGSEQSVVLQQDDTVQIELETSSGKTKVLKKDLFVERGEIIDAAVMSHKKLRAFLQHEVADAKQQGVLFSVHLKATMMKVSDPIIFGQAVEAYFAPVFETFADDFKQVGVDSRYGLGDLYKKIATLPEGKQQAIRKSIDDCLLNGPDLAMVDADKGITSLHVPSDVIIDASMPAAIRAGGQLWNSQGKLQDMKAVIPDRSYASVYQKTIEFCKIHGAFDPATMGSVSNVGLMAKKAEEYGSHDKTFWIQQVGTVKVVDRSGTVLLEHPVEPGDVWRMCQTKDVAVQDWVKLAVTRAQTTGTPAYFWLSPDRAHDACLIDKVKLYLKDYKTEDLDLQILDPAEATMKTLERVKEGQDTISVTGNVLRDYLTDLFPILELGTSAKMLSIVPLLAGGGLFETGAGGSAPKHVQQLLSENHLRWDSLGEFLALAVSLEDLAVKTGNPKAKVLAQCLDQANEAYLKNNKAPSRVVHEIDNRGSHFYLTLYWSQALAQQSENMELQEQFQPIAQQLQEQESTIMNELDAVQGQAVDLQGYYRPPSEKVRAIMRPSKTFNEIVASL
jgi:isocitrate dehydrogenase